MGVRQGAKVGDFSLLEAQAGQAAAALQQFSNPKRLLLLCELAGAGEKSVNDLAAAVGLSQSALSQHLARLRAAGLVDFRRDGQTLNYRIADRRAVAILKALKAIFCA
ncbi:MAG: metalloregulator ArsR/SmtB family transcription factor [Bauldia sp.]